MKTGTIVMLKKGQGIKIFHNGEMIEITKEQLN